jgi:ATP/maltotriose-dependent transcriptional regulator MalT
VIAEDSVLLAGLTKLLEGAGFQVVATAGDAGELLVRTGGNPLDDLTQREREVLALMAEGRSNTEIGAALVITDSAVSKHINSIFAKLGLYPGDVGHRRVLAVLRYLGVDPGSSA